MISFLTQQVIRLVFQNNLLHLELSQRFSNMTKYLTKVLRKQKYLKMYQMLFNQFLMDRKYAYLLMDKQELEKHSPCKEMTTWKNKEELSQDLLNLFSRWLKTKTKIKQLSRKLVFKLDVLNFTVILFKTCLILQMQQRMSINFSSNFLMLKIRTQQ